MAKSQKRKLILLTIFVFFITNVSASTHSGFEFDHVKDLDLSPDFSVVSGMPKSYFADAIRIKKAIEAVEEKNAGQALSEIKKIRNKKLYSNYVNWLLGSSYLLNNNLSEAAKVIPEIKLPKSKIEWELKWLKLDLLAHQKKSETLKKEINFLKLKYRRDKWIPIKGSFYLGKSYLLAKKLSLAKNHFIDVIVKNAGTEYDSKVFNLLKNNRINPKKYLSESLFNLRVEALVKNGYAYRARKLLESYIQKHPDLEKRYEERFAYVVFRERKYDEAAKLYKNLLKSGNFKSSKILLMIRLSQAYARSGQTEESIAINKKLVRYYPGSRTARSSEYKLGFLLFDAGKYKEAVHYIDNFLKKKKGTYRQRKDLKRYRLWALYLSQNYKRAKSEIEDYLKQRRLSNDDKADFNYWLGRVYDKMGKRSLAKKHYRLTAKILPVEYYGLLAKQRLRYRKLVSRFLIHDKLINYTPTQSIDDKLSLKYSKVKKYSGVIRAVSFYQAGLDNFAFNESQIFAKSHPHLKEVRFLKALHIGANYFHGYAWRRSAIAGAFQGCDRSCGYQQAYPQAFKKYVESYAKHWGLDEHLGYAVMRQESAFQPEIMSFAFAYGLMQIIPPTGEEIASRIGYRDFKVTDLKNPKVNTLFGTYYLKHLLDKFNNELVYAIAGYNAGPDAVTRWKNQYSNIELDEFIALIPYNETRKYVKKVLNNYLVYKQMYE